MVEAILIGLASFRIASLLVQEDGPYGIFEALRCKVGLKPGGEVSGFFPLLFSCIWCMSVWVTPVIWLIWQLEPAIVVILAAMTVALLADKQTRG